MLLGPDGEALEGVEIELLDSAGRLVRKSQSDFDGYLLFDAVPYGEYRLRLGASSAAALGVQADLGQLRRIDRTTPSLQLGRIRLRPFAVGQVAAAP